MLCHTGRCNAAGQPGNDLVSNCGCQQCCAGGVAIHVKRREKPDTRRTTVMNAIIEAALRYNRTVLSVLVLIAIAGVYSLVLFCSPASSTALTA